MNYVNWSAVPMSNKIITTTQCNRPKYTEQMLHYLSKCLGIENYTLIAAIEPGNDEVYELLSNFNSCETRLIVNDFRLTCNINTMKAMYLGLDTSDSFILHVEDDVLLSRDALVHYEKWCLNPNSFSFNLYSKINRDDYNNCRYNEHMYRDVFVPWGFGLSKAAFLKTLEWNCYCPDIVHYQSWDLNINKNCVANNLKHEFTFLSRSQNIGAAGGVHVPSAEWHKENQYLEFWADTIDKENNV